MRHLSAFALVVLTGASCQLEPLALPPSSDGGTPACAASADCDDVNPCTVDRCESGACTHAPAPEGTSCADSDACNGEETCDAAGQCAAGTPVAIDDGNACTADSCDPATGNVIHAPITGCLVPMSAASAPIARQH